MRTQQAFGRAMGVAGCRSRVAGWRLVVLIAGVMFALPALAGDPIHRWTDAQGRVHFGDRPPADAQSEVVEVRPNVYEAPSLGTVDAALDTGRSVVLYSAEWCGHCKRARAYFKERGIAFKEYDVETNARGRRDYKRMQANGVPVILVGRQRLNGFSPAAFERLYGG